MCVFHLEISSFFGKSNPLLFLFLCYPYFSTFLFYYHTSVKLFWSQPMASWTLAAAYTPCTWLPLTSMEPWTATKKLYHTVAVIPAPVWVTTQGRLSEFQVGCRLGRGIFTLPSYIRQMLRNLGHHCPQILFCHHNHPLGSDGFSS